MRRQVSTRVLLARLAMAASTVIATLIMILGLPAVSEGAAPPCTRRGGENNPVAVPAEDVIACLARGEPVDFDQVEVRGLIDFDRLRVTLIESAPAARVGGVTDPRKDLRLDVLAAELGRAVPGARLVRQPFRLRRSTLAGLRGPHPDFEKAKPYSPLVFLQTVDLTESTIEGAVELPHAIFRLPLHAPRVVFRGPANFRGVHFVRNAVFTGASFAAITLFANAEFAELANFEGVQAGASLNFARAVFHKELWFQSASLAEAEFAEITVRQGPTVLDDVQTRGPFSFSQAQMSGDVRFPRAVFGGPTRFDDAIFRGAVNFDRARFDADASFARALFEGARTPVAFPRATFSGPAVFEGSRFRGPAQFASALFNTARFADVHFESSAGFRHAVFATHAVFGGEDTRTVFGGLAAFDFATAIRATFRYAVFRETASFVNTTFGQQDCDRTAEVALDFHGVVFQDTANFESARFLAPVEFSRVLVTPGQLRLRWNQIDAAAIRRCPQDVAVNHMPPVHRMLESNFKAQQRVDDANRAFYESEQQETLAAARDANASMGERVRSWMWFLLFGLTAGYGVVPWRVFLILAGLWAVFAAAYVKSGRVMEYEAVDQSVEWKVRALPVRTSPSVSDPGSTRRGRLVLALAVSLAALTGVVFGGARMHLPKGDGYWRVLLFERLIGLGVMLLLTITVSNTIPVLTKFVGWIV